jgi:hypothetical protein
MIDRACPQMADWLEQAWLARYLDRELTNEENAWFEAYLLDKSHLLDAVEADENLRGVVRMNADALRTDGSEPPDQAPAAGASVAALHFAWAASLALCVGLTWFAVRGAGGGGAAISAAPSRVIYDTLRGSLTEPREEQGDPASPIRLYEIPLPAGSQLDSAFADVDGKRVKLPNPPVSTDGYITFALPSSWRQKATLHLKLKGGRQPSTDLIFAL